MPDQIASDTDPAADTGSARKLWFMGAHVTVHLARHENAGSLSVLEHRMPAGFGPPLHVHDEDETVHVLEGEVLVRSGEAWITARAGDTVHFAEGVPHGFRVVSPGGARCMSFTHGGFEDMVRAASRPALSGALPEAAAPTPQQIAWLTELAARHGTTIIGPPIG